MRKFYSFDVILLFTLILHTSFLKLDYDTTHVVTADAAAGCNISSQDRIKHFLNETGKAIFCLFLLKFFVDPSNGLLRRHAVPDAITSTNYEVDFISYLFDSDIWECCDNLVFRLHYMISFIFKVSHAARQSKHSVYPAFLYESVSSLYALFLFWCIRLVINAQILDLSLLRHYSSAVTCVCT